MQKSTSLFHRTWRIFNPEKYAPWPVIIIISCLVLVITVFAEIESLVRSIIAFWFLLVIPGMSIIKLLDINNPVYEWTLSVALSMTLGTIIAGIFVYMDHWDPNLVLSILVFISLTGTAFQILKGSTKPSVEESP